MLSENFVSDWNDILKNIIWKDTELKDLMKIPAKTSIVDFTKKYFIRAGYDSELLTNQAVRVIYGNTGGSETDVPNILRQNLTFDVYVRIEENNNVGNDRLVDRTDLIMNRILYLLRKSRYNGVYRFWVSDERDRPTRTIGYVRKQFTLGYLKLY
jgi:hypothetical protein